MLYPEEKTDMIPADEKLILIHQKAADRVEIITRLADLMKAQGYVGPMYLKEVLSREKDYPTGLPSEGVTVAIPHAASADVTRTGLAIAVMDDLVSFFSMEDRNETLQVEIVFLLANASGADAHLDNLQELMNCMSSSRLLCAVKSADTPAAVAAVLKNADIWLQEENS